MKGFGKGLALLCVVVIVAGMLQFLIGFEEGGELHGIACSLGCLVAYVAAVRIDAIKPMLGVSIYMCVMGVFNLALGDAGGLFMMIGPIVTLFLAIVRIRGNR